VPALIGFEQVPVASSQESVVHARVSLQLDCVVHIAEPLQTPQPAVSPSLQRAPVRALQPVVLTVGSHHWQELLPFTVPVA
jgi:hypothetical protein